MPRLPRRRPSQHSDTPPAAPPALATAIVPLPLSALHPNPRNPRTHSPRQVAQIAASIREFGFTVPILVDEAGTILAGHGRWQAALQLGMATVPTICLDHLTPAQKRAYLTADNRLAELAGWDRDLLAADLQELIELDFPVELTGFDTGEIDLMLDTAAKPAGGEAEPALPEPPVCPVSRPGDLWELGRHRLFCGDATDPASYVALMQGEPAQMVFIDPPYNVAVSRISGLGRTRHREFAMASGEMSPGQYRGFLQTVLQLLARHSEPGSIHFVCTDWRRLKDVQAAGEASYTEQKNLCVWAKTNAGMGSFYRSQHELVLVFQSGRGKPINNFGLGEKGRYRSNVWSYAGANSFRRGRDRDLADHPTVKPVALVADAIRDCSKRNGLVLDAFGGAGTTLLAAERTGRLARLVEIDPAYADVTVRRWQELTGGTARLAGSGAGFQEIAKARLPGGED